MGVGRPPLNSANVAALKLTMYLKFLDSKRGKFLEGDKRNFGEETRMWSKAPSTSADTSEAPWYLGKRGLGEDRVRLWIIDKQASLPTHTDEAPWYLGKRGAADLKYMAGIPFVPHPASFKWWKPHRMFFKSG